MRSDMRGRAEDERAERREQRGLDRPAAAGTDTMRRSSTERQPADECPYCGTFVGMGAHYDGAARERSQIPTDGPLVEGRYSERTCRVQNALGTRTLGCSRTFYVYSAILH